MSELEVCGQRRFRVRRMETPVPGIRSVERNPDRLLCTRHQFPPKLAPNPLREAVKRNGPLLVDFLMSTISPFVEI